MNYPTPHIDATPDNFAKTVLMPGDPLRAKYIAETYLVSPRLVNNVRGINGYTGLYKGHKISIMASGMGIPSIGIYSYELYNFFGVENIIRVGSCGGIRKEIEVRDIILAMGACTNSNYAEQYHLNGSFSSICSYNILKITSEIAKKMGCRYHIGNILSSDTFYTDENDLPDSLKSTNNWAKMGVLAVEMEAAALYMNAARAGKNAIAICTVSDNILTGEATTAEERQNSFNEMIILALETAVALDNE